MKKKQELSSVALSRRVLFECKENAIQGVMVIMVSNIVLMLRLFMFCRLRQYSTIWGPTWPVVG